MATEILRPQDCLIERMRDPSCRRRSYYGNYNPNFNSYNSNPRPNRKPVVGPERSVEQKKRLQDSSISKRSTSADDIRVTRNHHHHNNQSLLTDKVVILQRGESLKSRIKSGETSKKEQVFDMVVTGTDRLGPHPKMVPKQTRIADLRSPVTGKSDVYAGSAFAVSPAPSSLPLPTFSKKRQISVDYSATRDLRRLLGLDF